MVRVTDFDEIYGRLQKEVNVDGQTGKEIKKFITAKGTMKFTSGRKKLAETLSQPHKIKEEIDDIVFLKSKDEIKQLTPLEDKVNSMEIIAPRKELKTLIKKRKKELRTERLQTKGKTTTAFRDRLRDAKSEQEINKIISEAKSEISEGKNLQSLIEGAEIMKGSLGG